jgi:hypothetical protein
MYKGINNKEISEFKAAEDKEVVVSKMETVTESSIRKMMTFGMYKHAPVVIITKPEEEQVKTGHRACCE